MLHLDIHKLNFSVGFTLFSEKINYKRGYEIFRVFYPNRKSILLYMYFVKEKLSTSNIEKAMLYHLLIWLDFHFPTSEDSNRCTL